MNQIDINKTFTNQEIFVFINHAICTQKQNKNIRFIIYAIINDVRKYR